ncbi:hypothetical protein RJ640_018417 [Escallonia rubra]|uniref:Fe2OG dioxygenase domain-containing protein n=1 Tax=Escallonia rubra TaxID=112253 RepID=A0AA88UCD0_9ASTE|nr:hypothetical protein RJ640_018417 [Escallonia rubra]
MDYNTRPNLPVINFSEESMQPGTSSWLSACNQVRHALETYGCFLASYAKVSTELSDAVFQAVGELSELPRDTKVQNVADIPYFGYLGQDPRKPLLESMGIENAPSKEAVQSFTNLMWPSGNDHFCDTVHLYAKLVRELEQTVSKMVFQSYGVGKYYDSHNESTDYLLRYMHYRVPNVEENNLGVPTHTDKTLITILHQNQVCGLEVKTKEDEWIEVEFPPSSFVVMAGDAFQVWSNDRVRAASHRVIMKGNKARFTIGLFSHQKGIIEVPEELVTDENPLKFKPFDNFGYLRFSLTEEGRRAEDPVKAYSGV